MKTIRSKILVPIILLVSISLVLLGGISVYLNIASTNSTLEQTMTETAKISAERVSQEIRRYTNIAAEIGSIEALSNEKTAIEDKRTLIKQKAQAYAFQRGELILPDGSSLVSGNNYGDRDYFKASMAGNTFVSDPLVSKVTGELTIIVSAPLWKDGIAGGTVAGVVYFVPKETFLNDIVGSIKVSPNGSAYMLNKAGITIAHVDMDLVKNMNNSTEDAKTDPTLEHLASLEGKMQRGESGFGNYTYDQTKKFLAYSPVAGSDGWSLAINAPTNDFMAETNMSVYLTILLVGISLIVAIVVAVTLAEQISKPVKAVQQAAAQLARGDLHIEIQSHRKDEIGQMTNSFAEAARMIRAYIVDITRGMNELANGNFDIAPRQEFTGDFKAIADSIGTITVSLSDIMGQINQAAEQVSAGSDQVSASAQALSQGATQQASSVEELAATINDISSQVNKTDKAAETADIKVKGVADEIVASNEKMQQLIDAMDNISRSSGEIGRIIKTIEDIAFQTNILALNAAVEAARAGEAGKGFAVVADEVRNLASKSAEAAKNTTALIEGSVEAVETGTRLAGETAESLTRVVQGNGEVVSIVEEIDKATEEQAAYISQVTTGVDQISAVVQTNSATAEESAAASQELSGQAQMLKELVGRFKLLHREEDGSPTVKLLT